MAYLIETNILMRLANPNDALHSVADNAIVALRLRGEALHTAPQNLVEFRTGATRPALVNGLGYSAAVVEAQAAEFEALFPLLPEIPDIFPA